MLELWLVLHFYRSKASLATYFGVCAVLSPIVLFDHVSRKFNHCLSSYW